MSSLIPIKDINSLNRDLSNNGIVNNSHSDYNKYLLQKAAKEQEHCKIETIENELECLKKDLWEIKKLLLNFVK
jgi:hypothetical protein